jgi:hypothetical protein
VAAAKAFFKKAIRHEIRPPHTITLDGYAPSHRAGREMRTDGLLPKRTKLRSSKYLNNLIEQDHRGIKSRAHPALGFKNFESAAVKIAGACCLIARASPTHLRPISIFCTRAIYRGLDRTMRWVRERYQEFGYIGLFDQPPEKRVLSK